MSDRVWPMMVAFTTMWFGLFALSQTASDPHVNLRISPTLYCVVILLVPFVASVCELYAAVEFTLFGKSMTPNPASASPTAQQKSE